MKLLNAVAVGVLSLWSVTASAALSKELKEWGEGPAKWLFTKEDERAWRGVKTDQDAIAFIDLFWARRDPTPGTPENEFRNEFESRVAWADKQFTDPRRRGAMTDRGRAGIVLGFPPQYSTQAGVGQPEMHGSEALAGGQNNRQRGSRDEWNFPYEDAQKFGLPKLNIVFIEDPYTGVWQYDPLRPDFMAALPRGVQAAIKSPELKEVPEWAARGGLKPTYTRMITAPSVPTVTNVTVPGVVLEGKPGATNLMLVNNVFAISTETNKDPFTTITPLTSFTRDGELGYVTQYCGGDGEAPTLNVGLKITGMINGEKVNITAEPEEMVPDAIRVMPGCYLVRGSIPLGDFDPGDYDMTVSIQEAGGQAYNLTQKFRIE